MRAHALSLSHTHTLKTTKLLLEEQLVKLFLLLSCPCGQLPGSSQDCGEDAGVVSMPVKDLGRSARACAWPELPAPLDECVHNELEVHALRLRRHCQSLLHVRRAGRLGRRTHQPAATLELLHAEGALPPLVVVQVLPKDLPGLLGCRMTLQDANEAIYMS